MNKDRRKPGIFISNIISVIIVIVGVTVAFVLFYRSNVTRITHQNENYVADLAMQHSSLINDIFNENLSYIESAAIVLETGFQDKDVHADRLDVDDGALPQEEINKISEILKTNEKRFAFNYLRFIDVRGRNYTTGETTVAAKVNEREYYIEGMRGITGMTFILDSKITDEKQIGFYCPVRQNDVGVGVVVGFYGEDYINELLNISLFGYDCKAVLCNHDGTVIYYTGDDEQPDLSDISKALAARQNTIYSFREDGQRTVGYAAYIGASSDFYLVLNFPAVAFQTMIRNSGMNGVVLLVSLIMLFLFAGLFYIVRFLLQKKRLLEQSKNSNDIHFAMSRLFENFVIVNVPNKTYHYIEGMPDVGHIPNDGPYDVFADDLLKRFPDEQERHAASALISFEALIKEMNGGADIISYTLHAPIREEEWFTYNFIVVSRDSSDNVSEFIIARQDITKLQQKEEETRRILERARDEAEKGNRAKSDFLSSMSHDIRTPMNAIIGYTNIARDHVDDREMVSDSLTKIASSSHYLLSLINDVLDMSKIESGKLQVVMAESDLRDVFGRIADLTRSQAEKKHLTITYENTDLAHPFVYVDELRLEQVLVNITSNAVKYTPDGGSIVIRAADVETLADGKHRYCFSVKDTGVGISPEFLPHIFESFSRETNSTINKIQGTGLGMAITSRLVNLMGGSITVDSELGKGSQFTVTIDLKTWENGEQKNSDNKNDQDISYSFDGKRVLLVEDNDINAEIASLVLKQYGIVTERAVNGEKGVEAVKNGGDNYFDAVLMDIQMPVMNGYEATRAIREMDGQYYKNLPIIAMSANAYDDDIRASLESGMNRHIAKPFDPEELARELNALMHANE